MNVITIDNIYDPQIWNKLATIRHTTMARLVIDELKEDYVEFAIRVKKEFQNVCLMPQICDSYLTRSMQSGQFEARAQWIRARLAIYCSHIEIGNEVNGDWNHPDVIHWARAASKMFVGWERMLTLFVQPEAVEYWLDRKFPVELVYWSFYPNKMSDFAKYNWDYFFGCSINESLSGRAGFSEIGMEEWVGTRQSTVANQRLVLRKAMSLGKDVAWWNWQKDFRMWGDML